MSSLVTILKKHRVPVRVLCHNDSDWFDWDCPVFSPVKGYIETGRMGPVSVNDIARIEVNPIETQKTGRLVADRTIDHTSELTDALSKAGFVFNQHEGILEIPLNDHNRGLQLT